MSLCLAQLTLLAFLPEGSRCAVVPPTVGYHTCSDSATEQIKPVFMSDFLGFPVLPSSGRTPVALLFGVFGTLDIRY